MRVTWFLLPLNCVAALATTVGAQQPRNRDVPVAVRQAAEAITESTLAADLSYLASNRLGARTTPSEGLDSAADYVATRLARFGLPAAGDSGTYRQHFAVEQIVIDTAATFVDVNGRRFRSPVDFAARFGLPRDGTVSGTLAFVGHGVAIPSRGVDPYADIDYRNRILLLWGPGIPKGLSLDEWWKPGLAVRDNWGRAPAALWIPRFEQFVEWWQQRELVQEWILPPSAEPIRGGNPWILAGPTLVEALLSGERMNAAQVYGQSLTGDPPASFELSPTKHVTVSVATTRQIVQAANVVALIEGADPVLRHEYVTIQAHLDGIVNHFAASDRWGNAADDNASGVIALLGIADALARAPRPKRSIVLLWDAAEETTGGGARQFLAQAPMSTDKIVTHFNLDMVGRSRHPADTTAANAELTGPNEVYVIGPRSMSSGLDRLVEEINRSYLQLSYNRRFDTWESEWLFPRADHVPFLRRGIPVVFYFTGMHGEYHLSTDNPGLVDLPKLQRIARTAFVTAWTVADATARPVVDQPLPEKVRQ